MRIFHTKWSEEVCSLCLGICIFGGSIEEKDGGMGNIEKMLTWVAWA